MPFRDATSPEELGPFLTVVATDPASSFVVSGSIAEITVTFDRPLEGSLLSFNDVVIQVEQDGAWVMLGSQDTPPTESLDATGTQLILAPSIPLGPGHYRIVLPTGSFLMGADFSMIDDPGYDQVLSDFTIARPGVTLADATPISGVETGIQTVSGALDLANDPGAVALYQIVVPEGHHWRLGAEVSAQALGSSLLSTLALFDGQGHLIATSTRGRRSTPSDPYLYAGLEPGTYYLGVSGLGNDPACGGYDPTTGMSGTISTLQDGGAFQLNVVADPADSGARLLGFQLNWADPFAVSPTGMTLTFSGLLDLQSISEHGAPGFVVVDAQGATHPITLVHVQEDAARYDFLLNDALPAGSYQVRVVAGQAADLAGLTPVGSQSDPGLFASFQVAGEDATHQNPFDLGALYDDVLAGQDFVATIDPHTAVTYRFVALTEGYYVLSTASDNPSSAVELRLFEAGKPRSFDVTPPQGLGVYLHPGVHHLQFINQGTDVTNLSWHLVQQTPWDALLENGVGQGSALTMRLVQSTDGTTSIAPPSMLGSGPVSSGGTSALIGSGPTQGPFSPGSPPGGAVAGAGASMANSVATAQAGGLVLTLGNNLVGRPALASDHVAVVGPAPAGSVALAAHVDGIPQGIHIGQTTTDGRLVWPGDEDSDLLEPVPVTPGATPETVTSEPPVDGAMVVRSPAEAVTDESIVSVAADWMARVGRSALAFFTPGSEETPEVEAPLEDRAVAELLALEESDGAAELEGKGRVQEAHFDAPLVVGVVSVVAMRCHQPMLQWVRRNQGRPGGRRHRGMPLPTRGPHRRV